MTTKKAYEAQNAQQVFCDTAKNGNDKLHKVLDEAWNVCEDYDPYAEWGDNDMTGIFEALREVGKDSLARELTNEMVKAYGCDMVEVADWNDWGEDW